MHKTGTTAIQTAAVPTAAIPTNLGQPHVWFSIFHVHVKSVM